ncbi:MAG: HDOD domain-containing protein [Thiogranum sp.]
MWKRIRNIFSVADPEKPARPHRSGPAESISLQPSAGIPGSEAISSGYYSLILGVHSLADAELNELESDARARLGKLIKSKESRERMVPRLPAIIPKLMSSLRDDDVSGADLARQLGKDASLVADVTRMANSPYYRTVNKIQSLEQAVLILGRSGIRQLLACAAFKPILSTRQGHFTNLASAWVWRQSEYCAFSAQCLAKNQSIDAFEAYLAGLVRDIGTIIALKAMDQIEHISDAPRSYQFQRLFSKQSLQLSRLIASEWEFPDNVVAAIEDQTTEPDPGEMPTLASVVHAATLMSKLQILVEEHRVDEDLARHACCTEGGLTDQCRKCFGELQRYAA